MATRGSALSRSVEFFRSANLDEARVAFQLVKEVMEQRLSKASQPTLPFNKTRTRKAKAKERVLSPAEYAAMTASTKAIAENRAVAGTQEQEQTLADA